MERDSIGINCLAQEHNTATPSPLPLGLTLELFITNTGVQTTWPLSLQNFLETKQTW